MNAMQSKADFERSIRERGGVPSSAHSADCQGTAIILTSNPPKDGGVVGCTCGVERAFRAG